MRNIGWKTRGSCANHPKPDLWHSDSPGNGWEVRLAKTICADCPVIQECAEYSITNEEPWGIWAGITQNTRRRMIRAARRTA